MTNLSYSIDQWPEKAMGITLNISRQDAAYRRARLLLPGKNPNDYPVKFLHKHSFFNRATQIFAGFLVVNNNQLIE